MLKPYPKKLFLSCPHMGGAEMGYIQSAFEQNWIAPLGENVDRFEAELKARHAGHSVAALSSGTAALHLALLLAGVDREDTVLCQSFTFCASAFPISYVGATPVFVGSEPKTWNMCPQAFEDAILAGIKAGKKPKAAIYVHLYGTPALADEITEIAKRHDVTLIEDAAESLGSTYRGRPTGTLADFAILSFNGNKIITTSGGGALICKSEKDAERARFLATQARDPAPYYLHSNVGFNYRLSNICAGIGRGQLEVLDERVKRRREIFEKYRQALEPLGCFEFRSELPQTFENRWLSTALVKTQKAKSIDALKLVSELAKLNIECRPLWNPLHLQPIYSNCQYFGSKLEEDLFSRGLCLPSATLMTDREQDFVIDAVKSMVGEKV